MGKKIGLIFTTIILSLTLASSPTLAQSDALTNAEKAELTGTRKQLATIIFSGLAGAILGLSTLSFYGRPQEKLGNIAVGFAVGVIGGAIFTTYQTATKPYEAYDLSFTETQREKQKMEQFTPSFTLLEMQF